MIERLTSAELINNVANDPSVRPWICGDSDKYLDFSEAVETGRCIALFGEHGGFLFHHLTDGVFDGHSMVLPSGRGKWALRTVRYAIAWMFEREGAQEIMMAVPQGNLAVFALVRNLKATLRGKIEGGWWLNGQAVDSDIYSLTKLDWEKCQRLH
jgi:RimJ/RimL family protein N-acetyltransferase